MIEEESSEDLQVPLYWLGEQEYAKAVEPSTAGAAAFGEESRWCGSLVSSHERRKSLGAPGSSSQS